MFAKWLVWCIFKQRMKACPQITFGHSAKRSQQVNKHFRLWYLKDTWEKVTGTRTGWMTFKVWKNLREDHKNFMKLQMSLIWSLKKIKTWHSYNHTAGWHRFDWWNRANRWLSTVKRVLHRHGNKGHSGSCEVRGWLHHVVVHFIK